MTLSLEQSVKEKLRALAKSWRSTFEELWGNLVLERFLARLYRSAYRAHFILKGETLLARYIPLILLLSTLALKICEKIA